MRTVLWGPSVGHFPRACNATVEHRWKGGGARADTSHAAKPMSYIASTFGQGLVPQVICWAPRAQPTRVRERLPHPGWGAGQPQLLRRRGAPCRCTCGAQAPRVRRRRQRRSWGLSRYCLWDCRGLCSLPCTGEACACSGHSCEGAPCAQRYIIMFGCKATRSW